MEDHRRPPRKSRRTRSLFGALSERCCGYRKFLSAGFPSEVRRLPLWVEGLRLTHNLRFHDGCVNCIEWHPDGRDLLSSGDDLRICVWDAEKWTLRASYTTGHHRNVFCVKYVPQQDQSIVTCGADGEVRLTDLVAQEDGRVVPRVERLSRNNEGMTLKMEFLPGDPNSFLITHHDGTIRLLDLRNARRTATAGDANEQIVVSLLGNTFYSLCFDPTNPHQFAASTDNHFTRLYDLRKPSRPYSGLGDGGCVKLWAPPELALQTGLSEAATLMRNDHHVTDVRFSSRGDLLCNFSGDDVMLFSGDDADVGESGVLCTRVLQRFKGRRNEETFLKEARFMGEERFVCTGSDSGEVFVWRVEDGELVQRVAGDRMVVNGVAPHPFLPSLATCGIDNEVKIFEYRGGRASLKADRVKAAESTANPHGFPLPFQLRARIAADIVDLGEAEELLRQARADRASGNDAFRAKEVRDAIARYKEALQSLGYCAPGIEMQEARDEECKLCNLNLAACYLQQKEYGLAWKASTAALQVDPFNVKGLYRRARATYYLGRPREALRDVELGLSQSPEHAELLKLREVTRTVLKRAAEKKKGGLSAALSTMFGGGGGNESDGEHDNVPSSSSPTPSSNSEDDEE